MTDSPENDHAGAIEMDHVGRLINYAGLRENVRPERMDAARQRVAAHWEDVVAQNQRKLSRRRFKLVSLAASIIIAAGASFLYQQLNSDLQQEMTARVERVIGDVLISDIAAANGDEIETESSIITGLESRIALRMASGQSLRIDTSSEVIVHSTGHVTLLAGGVYIDTHSVADPLPIVVSTPLGSAEDVGTQFQVRFIDSTLIVVVRDGIVEVTQTGQEIVSVHKGRYLSLGDSGETEERYLPNDDSSWDWVETLVPDFKLSGASLKQYLIWFAHERGIALIWDGDASETNAQTVVLSGSIAGASLSESLQIVSRIANFEYRIDEDSIWVTVD